MEKLKKQMFNKLRDWGKRLLNWAIVKPWKWFRKWLNKSRFVAFIVGAVIALTFTYCYLTVKYEYRDLFGSRVVIFNNYSDKVDPVKAESNPEIEKVASPEVRGEEQSSPTIRLIKKTFPEDPKTAVAIAKCESQLDPSRIGDTHMDFYSYGLFQINQTWHKYPKEVLLNPVENVKIARQIYDGAGWQRWACYTRGGYKKYL